MRLLRVCTLLPLFVLAAGCGLPRPYYLEPPRTIPVSISPFSISYSGENGFDEFKGYEIYYRFYTQQNWSDYTGQTKEILEQNHFLPVCSSTDTFAGRVVVHSKPLIALSTLAAKQSTFKITIDFSNPQNNPPQVGGFTLPADLALPSDLRRSAATTSKTKAFTPLSPPPPDYTLYETLDPDMTNGDNNGTLGIPAGGLNTVYLVLYALSYGIFEGNPTFSTCVYLGNNLWSGTPAITVN